MATGSHADVLIIGAGAAGGLIAKTLAEAGLKVVCLDQGPWFTPREKPHARPDWEWQRATRWSTSVNTRSSDDYPIDTTSENTLMWNGVGGSTSSTPPSGRATGRPISARAPSTACAGLADHLRGPGPLTTTLRRADRGLGLDGDPAMPPRETVHDAAAGARCDRRPAGKRRSTAWAGTAGRCRWPSSASLRRAARLQQLRRVPERLPDRGLDDVSLRLWPKAIAAGASWPLRARHAGSRQGRARDRRCLHRPDDRRPASAGSRRVVLAATASAPRASCCSPRGRTRTASPTPATQVGRNLMHHALVAAEIWVDERSTAHKGVIVRLPHSRGVRRD